jgi:SAM-dependent methyltransferase
MNRVLKKLVPRSIKQQIKRDIEKAVAAAVPPPPAFETPQQELRALSARVADLEAALGQHHTILWREMGAAPPPPRHMQVRTVGGYVPGFLESGYSILDDLEAVLKVAGTSLASFSRMLDYGCGSGRTTRALKTRFPAADVHGTDIDPEAIAWLTRHCSRFGEFRLAPHQPPTSYPDAFFDFIVGISVFTHLPEDMQFAWLKELRRITKPGGLLILTTSGKKNYVDLPPDLLRVVEERGFCYVDGGYGQSISLPAFYQNTFHRPEYVREHWSRFFEVLDIQETRMQNHQDTVLLRNSGGSGPS